MARKKKQEQLPQKFDFKAWGKLGGRPRAFESPEEFTEAVSKYFGSITTTKPHEQGRVDNNGDPIYITEFFEPPSITGLCLYLKISRETWSDYAKKPGFSDTATHARMLIESYLQNELLTSKYSQGIIFTLKNNFGWAEKVDVKQDVKADIQSIEAFINNSDGAQM